MTLARVRVRQTEDEVFSVLEDTRRLHVDGEDWTVGPAQTLVAPTYRVTLP